MKNRFFVVSALALALSTPAAHAARGVGDDDAKGDKSQTRPGDKTRKTGQKGDKLKRGESSSQRAGDKQRRRPARRRSQQRQRNHNEEIPVL
jgi:hypothetical protein